MATPIKLIVREAAMSLTDIAREAQLSHVTVSKVVNGRLVSELSVSKVLRVLSQHLERHILIEDVSGINIKEREV